MPTGRSDGESATASGERLCAPLRLAHAFGTHAIPHQYEPTAGQASNHPRRTAGADFSLHGFGPRQPAVGREAFVEPVVRGADQNPQPAVVQFDHRWFHRSVVVTVPTNVDNALRPRAAVISSDHDELYRTARLAAIASDWQHDRVLPV